jgi:hypothetical protein
LKCIGEDELAIFVTETSGLIEDIGRAIKFIGLGGQDGDEEWESTSFNDSSEMMNRNFLQD